MGATLVAMTDPDPHEPRDQPGQDPSSETADLVAGLADLAGLDAAQVHLDDRLTEDLGLDSVGRLELLSMFDRRGIDLPEELVVTLATVRDVAHYWSTVQPGPPRVSRAQLAGPNVTLRPVAAADENWLFDLCTHPDHLVRYRLRGLTPSADSFHRFLWDRSLAQFVVLSRQGVPIGLVSAFEPDFRNRYAYVAAVADPALTGSGLIAEALAVLVTYLFAEFDLRKLYAESLASTYEQYASGAERLFDVEGRMVGHEYVHGRYEDFVVLAAHRDRWRTAHRRLFGTEPGY
jgi:RimJ/RimL family protein N-acetyltransferase/acyl carrier protein